MASSSKRKTTFAKLNRENKLRERKQEKAARKAARKEEAEIRRLEPDADEVATAAGPSEDEESVES